MKTQSWLLVIALIVIGFLLFDKYQRTNPVLTGADTTITINHYFDTTIHQTVNNYKTINNPIQSIAVETYPQKVDSSACDSVRLYSPTGGDTQVKIMTNLIVHGKLLKYKAEYQLLKPIRTEITKTIKIPPPANALIIGVGGEWNPRGSGTGLNIGYRKADLIFTGGYYTNKSATFTLAKQFFTW